MDWADRASKEVAGTYRSNEFEGALVVVEIHPKLRKLLETPDETDIKNKAESRRD